MRTKFGLLHSLILLLLLTLILAPASLAGLLDLRSASRSETAGDYASAASAYASAARRLPWQPSLWERAGMMAQSAGDSGNAILFLERAGQHNILSARGWLSLGQAYQQQGEASSAELAWEQALPLAEAYRSLAQAHREEDDYQAAIQDWRASLAQENGNAEAHYQLGLLLAATSPEEALPELMQAAQFDSSLDAPVQTLRTALNAGSISDDRAYQLLLAGRALGALGEWDLAGEAFRNAVAARATYAEAWAWLGEAEQQLGQDGSEAMARALAYNPNSAMVQGLYGLYFQRQGQPAEAVAAFQKAVDLEPDDAVWQMALGSAYEQTGDLAHAVNDYLRAVQLAPADVSTWRGLANFCLRNQADQVEYGLPAAFHLLELAPDDWRSYDIAGQMLQGTGALVGAELVLKKALQMAPLEAAPALHLGLLYLQTGRDAAARTYLLNAQTLDPRGPYGAQAQRLLERYFP